MSDIILFCIDNHHRQCREEDEERCLQSSSYAAANERERHYATTLDALLCYSRITSCLTLLKSTRACVLCSHRVCNNRHSCRWSIRCQSEFIYELEVVCATDWLLAHWNSCFHRLGNCKLSGCWALVLRISWWRHGLGFARERTTRPRWWQCDDESCSCMHRHHTMC